MSGPREAGGGRRPRPTDPASLPDGAWSTSVRVSFGRCDAAGIVYTPQYFDLFIGVLETWYEESLGFSLRELILDRKVGLGYAEAAASFFAPSLMGDRLTVTPILEHIGRSSFHVTVHAAVEDQMRACGRLVSVATSLVSGGVIPLPPDVRCGLERYVETCKR